MKEIAVAILFFIMWAMLSQVVIMLFGLALLRDILDELKRRI